MDYLKARSPVIIAVVFFVLIAVVIYQLKPRLAFNEYNEMREFGFEDGQTVFTYPVILGVVAVFAYLLTFIVVSFYNNRVNM